jgi:hypothetical protein
MNPQGGGPEGPWIYVIPIVVLALVLVRNARARSLKIERLWIAPSLLLLATVLTFINQKPPGLGMIGVYAVAFVVGALAGWWRGRLTNITINPETHELTSKASMIGILLVLGLFVVRRLGGAYAADHAADLHVSTLEVTDALLLLAVGLVCAQRLEIALRASRMLAEARASRA